MAQSGNTSIDRSDVSGSRISRREALRRGVRTTGAALLASVAYSAPVAFLGACARPPQAQQSAARPQLVVAQTADILTLDPPMHRARQTQNVHQLIFDSLVHRTEKLELQGRLAESWEMVDERTFKFKMRQNATWHDGKPVTAKDVKYSYDRTLDPVKKAPRAGLMDMVASVEAPDDSTVIVKTNRTDPTTLVSLNYHAIVPMDAVTSKGDAFFEKPIGAGPFTFEEWKKDERVVLKANPSYWDGAPQIDTLIIRPIADPATTIAELESGGIDIATDVPPASVDQIKANSNLQALTTPSTTVHFVGLNTTKKPLDNVAVRRALNHAIDKAAIIGSVLHGLAVAIPGPLFPEVLGFDPDLKGYAFDRDRAKALLSEGGAGSGFDITLDTTAPLKEASEALAGQLKQVGVNVSVNVMESGVLTQKVNQGESDMYYSTWGDSSADAGVTYYRHFHTSQRQQFKDTHYSKPELDKLIDEGRAATDPDKRKGVFVQALKTIVDDAPWLFLWQPMSLAAARANVKGFVPRPDAYLFLHKVTKG